MIGDGVYFKLIMIIGKIKAVNDKFEVPELQNAFPNLHKCGASKNLQRG